MSTGYDKQVKCGQEGKKLAQAQNSCIAKVPGVSRKRSRKLRTRTSSIILGRHIVAADNTGNSGTLSVGGFSKSSRIIINAVVLSASVLVGECKRILTWRGGRSLSLKVTIYLWRWDSAAGSACTLADRLLRQWRGARSRRSIFIGSGGASICFGGISHEVLEGANVNNDRVLLGTMKFQTYH
jgi:hypothetical protein